MASFSSLRWSDRVSGPPTPGSGVERLILTLKAQDASAPALLAPQVQVSYNPVMVR